MHRIVRYGIAAVAAVVALSACGAGGKASDAMPVVTGAAAARLIADSAQKAEDVGTARMRGDVTVEVAGQTRTMAMDGALDFRTGAFQFDMDLSDLGLPGADGMAVEMRLVDGVGYMRFVDAPGEVGERLDGRWIRLDPAAMGLGAAGSGGLDDSNPSSTMGALQGIDGVERVGTEDVRGVATTHYRGHVDLTKAMERVPDDLRAKLGQLGEVFSTDWPVEVWVDADGQTRRMVMTVDTALMKVHEEFEFYDFGTDVDLSAPAPDEVVDFQEVFGPLGVGAPAV